MTALELAATLCRRFEGCHLDPYHDPVGYPTVGYGRLLSLEKWADLSKWESITEAQAEEWLIQDLATAAHQVLSLIKVPLTDGQAAALIDFVFNLGAARLRASTLRSLANRGEYEAAADQFRRWVYAGGVKLPGLVARRAAEANLWQSR